MKLIVVKSGEELDAVIEPVTDADLLKIARDERFLFDWKKENNKGGIIYKLFVVETGVIVGLISQKDMPKDFRIHLNLIESSKENVGAHKRIDRIPGCLIAFACAIAFKNGYNGFVSLIPKTELINHYIRKYGFRNYGKMLAIEDVNARLLIVKYLENG
jgi:hypothetical protein